MKKNNTTVYAAASFTNTGRFTSRKLPAFKAAIIIFLALAVNCFGVQIPVSGARNTKGGATIIVAASDAPASVKAVADYVCDGTNDEVELEAAYAALPAGSTSGGGGTIRLSTGTFEIGTTIDFQGNTPVQLIGDGFLSHWPDATFHPAGTVLKLSDGANCTLLRMTVVSGSNGYSCGSIRDIWFSGNLSNNTHANGSVGVDLDTKGDIEVQHCMFYDFGHAYTIQLRSHGVWFFNNDIEDNDPTAAITGTTAAIYLTQGTASMGWRNWIQSCHFARNGGIESGSHDIFVHGLADNVWITNCNFEQSPAAQIALSSGCEGAWVTNCRFDDWGLLTSVDGAIEFPGGSGTLSDIFITNNFFDGGGEDGDYGIRLDEQADRVVIRNNTFHDIDDDPIYISPTQSFTKMRICDNVGANETYTDKILELKFNNTWNDSSGRGNDAVITLGLPTNTNNYAELPGSDDAVDLGLIPPDFVDLTDGDGWTINLYAYVDTWTDNAMVYIYDTAGTDRFNLALDGVLSEFNVNFGDPMRTTTTSTLGTGEWFMATVVQTLPAGGLYFYINGILLNSWTQTTITDGGDTVVPEFTIGGTDAGLYDFDGRIDDFTIWDRPLSASEILALYEPK